jgi:cyclohexanecarboxyl-CoA dehydrogenase
MQGFDFSRALIGLQCIAPAQASRDESWIYASERQAFGAPLSRHQGVTFLSPNARQTRRLCVSFAITR